MTILGSVYATILALDFISCGGLVLRGKLVAKKQLVQRDIVCGRVC